jgi:peptide/nickel transport system ATP-binding protein
MMTDTRKPALLTVDDLTLRVKNSHTILVDRVGFDVQPGEIVGIVGESGSGKSMVSRSILGFRPVGVERTSGMILLDGTDVTRMDDRQLRDIRGTRVGMVFQEPMTSLNPSMKIGEQMDEGLRLHTDANRGVRQKLILDMLRRVGIREPEAAIQVFPHQFSGGMRQRIMLASVMLLKPALLIADEPTTALDTIAQKDVLDLMVGLTKENGTAVLLISHDLGLISQYCSRAIVMQSGVIVEQGRAEDILTRSKHPYTQKLVASLPHRSPARRMPVADVAKLKVRNLVVEYAGTRGLVSSGAAKRVLHGVDLTINPGEVVAVVGGSGSGKTTLGQSIAGLIRPASGDIRFDGQPIEKGHANYWNYRMNCQMVFQDPYSSLDPRMTIGQLVGEALRMMGNLSAAAKRERVIETLHAVGLGEPYFTRYPHQLSGGQRQRVAIARAVVRRPSFVIADEPVSALDVTVRAQVLELFANLQQEYGFSCLFISHDLGVVEQIADKVVVLHQGKVVEQGTRDEVFDNPQHDYTRLLLAATPHFASIWQARAEGASVSSLQ